MYLHPEIIFIVSKAQQNKNAATCLCLYVENPHICSLNPQFEDFFSTKMLVNHQKAELLFYFK